MLTVDEIFDEFRSQRKAAGRFAGRLDRAITAIDEARVDLDLADALERHAIHLEGKPKPEARFIFALIEGARLLRAGPDLHF